MEISDASRTMAGILLLSIVTVQFGGIFMLQVVQGRHPTTDIQKSFFRAGHAHAGVLVILGLVLQPYVDATDLDGFAEWLARAAVPAAAILMPAGFFFSVLRRDATKPTQLVGLLYAGAVMLAVGVVTAGIGLLTA